MEELTFTTGYKFDEVGYIRKPFRHYSTEPIVNGDEIVLTVDNFTGVDWNYVTGLLKCGDAFAAIFDIEVAKTLLPVVGKKEYWKSLVIDKLNDPDVFVAMDW